MIVSIFGVHLFQRPPGRSRELGGHGGSGDSGGHSGSSVALAVLTTDRWPSSNKFFLGQTMKSGGRSGGAGTGMGPGGTGT